MWSGCAIYPKGAKDGLVSKAFYAQKRSQLTAVRGILGCMDSCVMGNLNDAQRDACGRRCNQQYGY